MQCRRVTNGEASLCSYKFYGLLSKRFYVLIVLCLDSSPGKKPVIVLHRIVFFFVSLHLFAGQREYSEHCCHNHLEFCLLTEQNADVGEIYDSRLGLVKQIEIANECRLATINQFQKNRTTLYHYSYQLFNIIIISLPISCNTYSLIFQD